MSVFEGSNVTLQCAEKGLWIIEESHRGGPVRKFLSTTFSTDRFRCLGTQYTTELIFTNVQRDDHRFHTVTCSTHDGHEKRKYLIDVTCMFLFMGYVKDELRIFN